MILTLWLAACGPHEIPAHLLVSSPTSTAPLLVPHDLPEALVLLVGSDPLVRRPQPGSPGRWASLTGGAPLEAWSAVARKGDAQPQDWFALERAQPGTPAVALARGAALAAVESALGSLGQSSAEAQLMDERLAAVTAWLAPVRVEDRPPPPDARPPLAWLGARSPPELREAVLSIAERRVLLGWLDGPEIPVKPAASALMPGYHDRLISEPAGALLIARAAEARAPDLAARGRTLLDEATTLALLDAAADRDAEQTELKIQREQRAAAHGLPLDVDPLPALLASATSDLTADAADEDSVARALVALSAARLGRSCGAACRDLDRTAGFAAAERWSPSAAALARSWRLIAVKRAVDTFEVSVDRPSMAAGLTDLVDALLGAGGGPVPASLLRRRRADAQLFLDLSRAAGQADQTDANGALAALHRWLVERCDDALAAAPPADQAAIITRIRRRAAD